MKCTYHPETEAVTACSKCGNPVCNQCTSHKNGKTVCVDCSVSEARLAVEDYGKPIHKTGKTWDLDLSSAYRFVFIFIVIFGTMYLLLGLTAAFHPMGKSEKSVKGNEKLLLLKKQSEPHGTNKSGSSPD